jgi:hypothetical protein
MSFLRPSATKQTTSSVGTGTLALNVNSGDTRSFQTALGAGPTKCRYMLRGQGYFEMGRGTFTAPSALTRDEPLISSNANALVSIPAGATDVYLLDYAQFVVDSFSGTTKTLTNADVANTWIFTGTSAAVLNLPAISATLPDFWGFIRNAGTVNLTLTAPGTDVIDETGTQTVIFAAGDSGFVYLDTANTKWRIVRTGGSKVASRQILTSGSGATYTTPTGARQLQITIVGGGGGGGGNATDGTGSAGGTGGSSSFDNAGTNYVAIGGSGGQKGQTANAPDGGNGGTGGTGGTSPNTYSIPGGVGGNGLFGGGSGQLGGNGGSSALGGGVNHNTTAIANSGAGGCGAPTGGSATPYSGGGGGGGECKKVIINAPAATYTYTVGAAGTAGTAGTGGNAGTAGASGRIIVEEFY